MAWSNRAQELIDHQLAAVSRRFGPVGRQKVVEALEEARKAKVAPLSIIMAIVSVLLSGGGLQKLIDAILALITR